jgi:pyruvate, water dikinase
MLNFFKNIFNKNTQTELDFSEKFNYFQLLLEENNEAHKLMTGLFDIVESGKPFSRGQCLNHFELLVSKIDNICKYLTEMSGGSYKSLSKKHASIVDECNKILQAKVFCPDGWVCPTYDCNSCEKVKIPDNCSRYYYCMNQVDIGNMLEVGGKMSRLGEIQKKLNIPVPDGFCLTIDIFNEFMSQNDLRHIKNEIFRNINFDNIKEVNDACHEAQNLIVAAPLPDKFESSVYEAFDKCFGDNQDVRLAVRSSAVGEDSADFSFAGLHHTELNIRRNNLVDACINVLISKYSPQSVIYRYKSGLRDEDMPMSIGCIRMIDAYSGGVLYTRDVVQNNNNIVIQGVFGLGAPVVDGSIEPQEIIVEHHRNAHIVSYKEGNQKFVYNVNRNEGISVIPLMTSEVSNRCISDRQLKELVNYALMIERHFNCPQDIEWACDQNGSVFILQTRPLKLLSRKEKLIAKQIEAAKQAENYKIVLEGGDCASPGVSSGEVYIIKKQDDIDNFPPGAILVTRKSQSVLASLIHKAAGVITDIGSVTGHLSIIAREQDIPLLTNTKNATSLLKNGMLITLDSENRKVYYGYVEKLIELDTVDRVRVNPFLKSPQYKIWSKVTRFISKLNLVNPHDDNFRVTNCKTMHDVLRFAHEMAMRTMFSVYERNQDKTKNTHILKFSVPLDIFVIDMGNGLKKNLTKHVISVEDIESKTLLALISGMTTPGVKWSGFLPMDTKSFAGIIFGNIVDVNQAASTIGSRTYAIISENYINFFSRLGYHFSRLDAFADEEKDTNYINYSFWGGASDDERKSKRAEAIGRILEHYNFTINRVSDNLTATIRRIPREEVYSLLVVIGRLMGAIRNTDVIMLSDKIMDEFIKLFINGDPSPGFTIIKNW